MIQRLLAIPLSILVMVAGVAGSTARGGAAERDIVVARPPGSGSASRAARASSISIERPDRQVAGGGLDDVVAPVAPTVGEPSRRIAGHAWRAQVVVELTRSVRGRARAPPA